MNRFKEALLCVNPGACNPSGIAHSIVEHCREMRDQENAGTADLCGDPAIRLMVYQLAFICNVANGFDQDEFARLVIACEERKPLGAAYMAARRVSQ